MGHIDWLFIALLLLSQGIVGWYYPLSFHEGCSSVPYAEGDKKEAFRDLSLAFSKFHLLLSWLSLRYFWVISLLGTFPKQKKTFQPQPFSMSHTIIYHYLSSVILLLPWKSFKVWRQEWCLNSLIAARGDEEQGTRGEERVLMSGETQEHPVLKCF